MEQNTIKLQFARAARRSAHVTRTETDDAHDNIDGADVLLDLHLLVKKLKRVYTLVFS